jgi:hypothetical protein
VALLVRMPKNLVDYFTQGNLSFRAVLNDSEYLFVLGIPMSNLLLCD